MYDTRFSPYNQEKNGPAHIHSLRHHLITASVYWIWQGVLNSISLQPHPMHRPFIINYSITLNNRLHLILCKRFPSWLTENQINSGLPKHDPLEQSPNNVSRANCRGCRPS